MSTMARQHEGTWPSAQTTGRMGNLSRQHTDCIQCRPCIGNFFPKINYVIARERKNVTICCEVIKMVASLTVGLIHLSQSKLPSKPVVKYTCNMFFIEVQTEKSANIVKKYSFSSSWCLHKVVWVLSRTILWSFPSTIQKFVFSLSDDFCQQGL